MTYDGKFQISLPCLPGDPGNKNQMKNKLEIYTVWHSHASFLALRRDIPIFAKCIGVSESTQRKLSNEIADKIAPFPKGLVWATALAGMGFENLSHNKMDNHARNLQQWLRYMIRKFNGDSLLRRSWPQSPLRDFLRPQAQDGMDAPITLEELSKEIPLQRSSPPPPDSFVGPNDKVESEGMRIDDSPELQLYAKHCENSSVVNTHYQEGFERLKQLGLVDGRHGGSEVGMHGNESGYSGSFAPLPQSHPLAEPFDPSSSGMGFWANALGCSAFRCF